MTLKQSASTMSSLLESIGLRRDLVLLAAVAFGIAFLFAAYEWMRKGRAAKAVGKSCRNDFRLKD